MTKEISIEESKLQITDEQIDAYVVELMKSNPVKFVQYCLVVIGRDILQSNANYFKFSQESDLEAGRRFKIEVRGKIKEIKKRANQSK